MEFRLLSEGHANGLAQEPHVQLGRPECRDDTPLEPGTQAVLSLQMLDAEKALALDVVDQFVILVEAPRRPRQRLTAEHEVAAERRVADRTPPLPGFACNAFADPA